MTLNSVFQILFYLLVVVIFIKPLGWYIARVYQGQSCGTSYILKPLEHIIYRICGIKTTKEMDWKQYLFAIITFNLLGFFVVYGLLRLQQYLPFNPQHFNGVPSNLAFNTSSSFLTNTDWQAYSGETTLSYFSQMVALTVQNFLSAATGMAVLAAFIRGLTRSETHYLGNFWIDITRGVLYILLPLAMILAIILISQGVIQNFKPYETTALLHPIQHHSQLITTQTIPMGPVASQVAIKQLGSNGGGFFNVNSAHPFENPTTLSNFLEMLAILLIPAALCYTFGMMINDKRQGWALLVAMLIMLIPLIFIGTYCEQKGSHTLIGLNVDMAPINGLYPGGNMEGKESRFGITNSVLWTAATTATSNGSVNSMLDSYTAFGSMIPLWLMHLGEIVFGGVGSGLYGMLILVIITVFIAGLMVGRTPEYLGKKIEPFEMKMASFSVLLMPLVVLVLTAIAVITPMGTSAIHNSGIHGFSEILYAFTSMGNNNGSAFAGLNANTPFYNIAGGIEMLVLRFWLAIPALAIAGSMVRKKIIPNSLGTLPTHTPLFIFLLVSIAILIGALTFFPALALGPIVEHLMSWGQYGK